MRYFPRFILAAAAALMLAGCQQEPVTPDNPDGPVDPIDPVDPEVSGIRSAADFVAFAKAVNAGESIAQWQNEEGWVNLLADIDFNGVTDFVPVGFVIAPWTGYNPVVTEGNPFLGKFDGNAHHIKNLHLTDAVADEGRHFGLFGYLGKGAIVQNFVLEESCSLTVTSSAPHSAGLIAGVLYDATVRDVTSYAPLSYKGGASGLMHIALIGGLYGSEEGCTVDSVHNRGDLSAENTANLNAGATAIHLAGIVGFSNTPTGSDKRNVISSCNNYGKMTSQAGRTAGILAAANACTSIIDCENRGDQLNTMPKADGSRLGNICCFTNNGSSITGCKNYGNLVSTTSGRVGGIVSLPNAGTYDNNENYGEIVSDSEYRGVFWGYVTQAAAWSGGHASGKVGTYNGGSVQYDLYSEDNKVKYLGKDGSSGKCTVSDVSIDIATGDEPVETDPQIDVEAGFRILFIGNSFTKDAVEHLPKILAAANLNNIQLVHMYYGGRTIPEYNSGWSDASDYHCYVCNPGKNSWTDLSGKTLAQVARSGKWDVVTIQEHTGREIAWSWTATQKNAVQGLVDKVKAAQKANGGNPKLYYILSQAYHDLSKAQNVTKPFSTTDQMWTVIASAGKKAVEECGFDGVISTGAMLQNLRTSGLNNNLGLSRDGYHMDYGISRYGASCTVFETIIGPFNGNVTMDTNTFRTSGDSEGTTAITDERAPIALKAARYAIAKPYEVTDMAGEGGGGGGGDTPPDVEPDDITIASASDLMAFAARVNSGDQAAVKAHVKVTADIDCSSISTWTPIGTCTMTSWTHVSLATAGNLFEGTFDGQHHTIRNLAMDFVSTDGWAAYGFFGGIGDGAVVKNLTFDASCSMTVSASYGSAFGVLAGLVNGATIDNIKNYAPVTGGGTASLENNNAAGRTMVGGIIGEVHANAVPASLSNLHNYADIGSPSEHFSRGANTGNGANGFEVGGVAAFSTNVSNTTTVTFTDCVNDGNIYTNAGRSSGMVTTCNRYTQLKDCTNNGNLTSSCSGTFRLANISCIAGEGTVLDGCINTGDLIALDVVSVAGVLCLVNNGNVQVKNCASLGATILGKAVNTGGNQTYNGVLFGYCNQANAKFSDCRVSGVFGTSQEDKVTLTADNYFQYVGENKAGNTTITTTTITFAAN